VTTVTNSANFSLAVSGATYAIPFDTERSDPAGMHDTTGLVAPNTRLTAQTSGQYLINGGTSFAANATGDRQLGIRLNAGGVIKLVNAKPDATNATTLEVSYPYPLNAGDFVELVAVQTSGVALNIVKANSYSPELSMTLLG
jgi:hypothetical protein